MRSQTVGDGAPEVAVVGAVHGDEPCGANAIREFLDSEPTLERPAVFIIANERALEEGRRYVDVDLNRVLPGDRDADEHERRLAAELVDRTEDCVTLGIHSTRSYAGAFGALSAPNERKRAIFDRMPLGKVIDTSAVSDGRCVDQPMFVDVEVGPQGSEQASELALRMLRSFLRAVDALPGSPSQQPTDYFEVTEIIGKEAGVPYEFVAENFERVASGDVYARKDGDPLVADEPFWPVLASGNGHDRILGYRSRLVGD